MSQKRAKNLEKIDYLFYESNPYKSDCPQLKITKYGGYYCKVMKRLIEECICIDRWEE